MRRLPNAMRVGTRRDWSEAGREVDTEIKKKHCRKRPPPPRSEDLREIYYLEHSARRRTLYGTEYGGHKNH